jgi:all-trans-retinol dehydrogenase (NAD+)
MSESYIKADVPHEEFKLKLYRVRTQVRIAFGVTWLLLLEFLCFFRDLFLCNKEKNVSGQVCLVTGGANGLGRCIAMEFASKGCHIAIADIIDSSNTVNEIKEKFKVECEGFKCDISNVTSIQKMKCDIEKSIGPVDILVNNAAMILCDRFKNCTIEQISRCVDVNLTSNIKVSSII